MTTKRYNYHGLVTGVSITSAVTNKALISLQKYNMKEADKLLNEAEELLSDSMCVKPFDYYCAKSLYFLKMNQEKQALDIFNEARQHYPHLIGDIDYAYMLNQNGKYKECIEFVE
eukprot:764702_1